MFELKFHELYFLLKDKILVSPLNASKINKELVLRDS
jgi:hypothetical protein